MEQQANFAADIAEMMAGWNAIMFVHEMFKDGGTFTGIGIGAHDNKTQYITGKETFPDSFDDDIRVECSNGIHFFMTKEEAEAY